MQKLTSAAILVLTISLVCAAGARADIHMPAIFSDHMMLQQGAAALVWGTADAGEKISITLGGKTYSTAADEKKHWSISLDKLPAGPAGDMVVSGVNTISIHDVLVGEVWLCAGDATMSMQLIQVPSLKTELTPATYPSIRMFRAAQGASRTPQADVAGVWVECDVHTLSSFPALPYCFGRDINVARKLPVGLIVTAHDLPVEPFRVGRMSGVTIESFIRDDALAAEPVSIEINEYYKTGDEMRDALEQYDQALQIWKNHYSKPVGQELLKLSRKEPELWYDYAEEMRKASRPVPPIPPSRPSMQTLKLSPTRAGNLFNAMINPLAGYGIRGFAFCNGSANASRAKQYRKLFEILIDNWRRDWKMGDLPFVFVQYPRVNYFGMDPRAWAELRQSQATATEFSKVAMAPTIDLIPRDNVLPNELNVIGSRLAACARRVAYGELIEDSGPVVRNIRKKGNEIIVTFTHTGGGLATRAGEVVKGFAISGDKPKIFTYADAKIDGDTVILSHPKISAPSAFRYDWVVETGMEGNLIGRNGLPAVPYRSDDLPALTDGGEFTRPSAAAVLRQVDLFPVFDPDLPRVLLIGDSIMTSYAPYVAEALRRKANIHCLVSGTSPENAALNVTTQWNITPKDFAVIHYNDGLHSMPPIEGNSHFAAGLREALHRLQTSEARVIWATITPFPDVNNTLGQDSWNETVIARNTMGKFVAAECSAPVDDLYELVISRREQLQVFGSVHFNPEGCKLMGDQVAAKIAEVLNQRGP